MRIICAPDSFKESMTAAEAANAMTAGIAAVDSSIEVDQCPIADGGEHSLEALMAAMGGRLRTITVTGPLGEPVEAAFCMTTGGIGIVELAQASGLALVPMEQRDPTQTTSYGTGELIAAAADAGCHTVIVCIGGSATCDGGAGIAQALGVKFYDTDGRVMTEPMTGGTLHRIASIEPADELPRLRVACDVTNPLLGENGAAAVYGPQKGATPEQVAQLEAGLKHLASLTTADSSTAGAGASGGAGFGLAALCGAQLERGIELVLDAVNFDERCRHADLVITGEGRLDGQSMSGKATIGIAQAAQRHGVSTIALVGDVGEGAERCLQQHDPPGPLWAYHSLTERFGNERARNDAQSALRELTAEVVWQLRENRSL